MSQVPRGFREEGHEINVRVTWENADVERYVGEALSLRSVHVIIAAGGDGTVNEVASSRISNLLAITITAYHCASMHVHQVAALVHHHGL